MKLFPYVEFKRGKGTSSKKEIIVFLAGFPDDAVSGWQPLVDRLLRNSDDNEEKDLHLICLCLPGYETGAAKMPLWGYTFFELTQMMHATLEHLLPGDHVRYTLVLHDWGCFVGFLYQTYHPSKISRTVALDVGFLQIEEAPLRHTLILIFYQSMFAISFIVSQLLGHLVGQCGFVLSLFFLSMLPFLSPCPHDRTPRPLSEISVEMCYPYYQMWKDIFTNKVLKAKFPQTPLLFMFGTKKNCMFHSPSFLKRIEAMPNSKWVSYDVGHWLHLYEVDQVTKEIEAFLRVPATAVPVPAEG